MQIHVYSVKSIYYIIYCLLKNVHICKLSVITEMTSKPAIRKALDFAKAKRHDHVIRAEIEYIELKKTTDLLKDNNKKQVSITRVNAETCDCICFS